MAIEAPITTGATGIVTGNMDNMWAELQESLLNSRNALDDVIARPPLTTPSIPIPGVNPNYDIDYTLPSSKPDWDYAISLPTWRNHSLNLTPVINTPVEDFTGNAPGNVVSSIPLKPKPEAIADPGLAPIGSTFSLPDVPQLDNIENPKQYAITIPVAPELTVPIFDSLPPNTSGINIPDGNFKWSESEYDSNLLRITESEVSRILAGGTGIPDVIWEAIWNKENDRENRVGSKLISDINL